MHGQRRSVDAIGWSDRVPTRESAGRSAFHQVGRMQSASFARATWLGGEVPPFARLRDLMAERRQTSKTADVVGGGKGNTLDEAAVAAADRAILRGGAGADTLIAGRHAALTGGGGSDRFELTTPGSAAVPDQNTIADFKHGADKIGLAEAGFGLGAAPSAATLFQANPTAGFTSAAQRFAYDTTDGRLFFDHDGSRGASSPELIATFSGHPTLTASDLFFFAGSSG